MIDEDEGVAAEGPSPWQGMMGRYNLAQGVSPGIKCDQKPLPRRRSSRAAAGEFLCWGSFTPGLRPGLCCVAPTALKSEIATSVRLPLDSARGKGGLPRDDEVLRLRDA